MTPQPQQSVAATAAAVTLIVRHPEGSIRVSTLTDVPLRELLPDLLELAALPDHDGWGLGPVGGDVYPREPTLAELGVVDGALLALRELAGRGSADRESATTQRMIPSPRGPNDQPGGRPLSDRSARLLPLRLSIPARCLTVVGALARGDRGERRHATGNSGSFVPAEFTRPARQKRTIGQRVATRGQMSIGRAAA